MGRTIKSVTDFRVFDPKIREPPARHQNKECKSKRIHGQWKCLVRNATDLGDLHPEKTT
jgi:hypothetical protein